MLSRNLEKTLHRAFAYANERRHEYATLEHLLLALIDDQDAADVLRACSVDVDKLRRDLMGYVDNELVNLVADHVMDAKPTASFQRALQRAAIHVQSSGREEVTGANVLVAMFAERESHAVYFLQEQDMSRFDAVNFISHGLAKAQGTQPRTKADAARDPGVASAALFPVTEHLAKSARHTTAYLACGAEKASPIVFVHGWPELSLSWRHQLPVFAALGFRAVAPDMRGYGGSSVYARHEDYALEHAVQDMLELLDALGHERAIWVGHDWGSPVAWALASHHPERSLGIANLCVPYFAQGFTPQSFLPLIDRAVYPEAEYPLGQWDYQEFYVENFDRACGDFEADVASTVKALFRAGNPAGRGKPARTATIRRDKGWFGGAGKAPAVPLDTSVLTPEDLGRYVGALERNGFFGPDSWYMNRARNAEYAQGAPNGGRLTLPVLFLHAAYDYVCETVTSRLAEPMRRDCRDLTEVTVNSGHWMAQEQPVAVNAALARWLATRFPELWPR
jgi:pimeloyl-ACP methyl ester carboxylesterase